MTLATLQQAAQACYDLYDYEPGPTVWSYKTPDESEPYYGITNIGDSALVVFRGTVTLEDFMKVIEIFPQKVSPIGYIHPGAWDGMEQALLGILKLPQWPRVQFTGHSLGAMRATLATAALNAFYGSVLPRICFGECMSGGATESGLANIKGSQSIVSTYQGRYDPLYRYPFLTPIYAHATTPSILEITPDGSAPIQFVGDLALHYLGYYLAAIKRNPSALRLPPPSDL